MPIEEMIRRFGNLLDRDASYRDGEVVLPFENHAEAIRALRDAREALEVMRKEWEA